MGEGGLFAVLPGKKVGRGSTCKTDLILTYDTASFLIMDPLQSRYARQLPPREAFLTKILLVVAEVSELLHTVAPVLFDLYPRLKKNLTPEEPLHILAGIGGNFLEH